MKRIAHYQAPTPDDLNALKKRLGLTSAQMGDLCALGNSAQFRKYTSPAGQRLLSPERHFLMAALLTLDDAQLATVLEAMREHGAGVDLEPLGPKEKKI